MITEMTSTAVDPVYLKEPEDELKCAVCLKIAQNPMQHEDCGTLFCKECLEQANKPCPRCASEGSNYYRDKRSKC
jgi:late competence protein required for DNA uptake (superfamily II DNA/RNA helicase)